MHSSSGFLITIGGILLLGLLTNALGQRTFLPRVSLLLLFGVLIGKDFLNIIPSIFADRFEIIANIALLMIGFLLGGRLTFKSLKQTALSVFWISISSAIFTAIIVSLGLYLIGTPKEVAILLGCIAAATAPAAIYDVTLELKGQSPFRNLLLSIVTIDDVWALILFSAGIAIVTALNGGGLDASSLGLAGKEIGGSILLGFAVGLPAAFLTGRLKQGQPILTEALSIVFICGGLAIWLELSYLITSIITGAVIANFAKHHEYPFHAIEGIEWPFMVIFFVLAGASLEINSVMEAGLIGIVYILCRIAGKIIGARAGSHCCRTDESTKKWMGIALLPQAGVAIGMALVAANHFPEYRQIILSIVISSTVFFEIIGPVLTKTAILRAEDQSTN